MKNTGFHKAASQSSTLTKKISNRNPSRSFTLKTDSIKQHCRAAGVIHVEDR